MWLVSRPCQAELTDRFGWWPGVSGLWGKVDFARGGDSKWSEFSCSVELENVLPIDITIVDVRLPEA